MTAFGMFRRGSILLFVLLTITLSYSVDPIFSGRSKKVFMNRGHSFQFFTGGRLQLQAQAADWFCAGASWTCILNINPSQEGCSICLISIPVSIPLKALESCHTNFLIVCVIGTTQSRGIFPFQDRATSSAPSFSMPVVLLTAGSVTQGRMHRRQLVRTRPWQEGRGSDPSPPRFPGPPCFPCDMLCFRTVMQCWQVSLLWTLYCWYKIFPPCGAPTPKSVACCKELKFGNFTIYVFHIYCKTCY